MTMNNEKSLIAKTDLKTLSKQELESLVRDSGLPSFRTRQLLHWIYEKRVQSVGEITEFSKELRDDLSKKTYIGNLTLIRKQTSVDGTEKFLFGLEDNEAIESVLISDNSRLTLCISSQVGCAMKCSFCLTGKMNLRRNLKAHEIVDQVIAVGRLIEPQRITNIVFMGMGEPLANFDEVVESLRRMTALLKISKRRITLSTCGIAPKIPELGGAGIPRVNLAVSLNATTDEVRDSIMPVNRKHPLASLLSACRHFPLEPRRRITFEYVLLEGMNDTDMDADRLVQMLRGIPCKVNLIPFNPYKGSKFRRPTDGVLARFQNILLDGNITALLRKSKGPDILAACGQLKAGYC
ncbi:MAG TPA: 23S rRNA (adenine(2503)-C(2))-methyltransferase RlmN [Thermodesulfovibrionales bacterium]|nr:23S rRNA (adenine(2503)-C(2))-methyltransferase RlmN [Thermodesulfovibrionales bacterium]